ncbi:anti-phage dCTP deaminase [uncultured Marinobacter sp.]|uniref:anti-phage dCTP deaminase n=1 Tax=uncultured Marinobacter sp. TaxID=187379 RepID=UPI0030C82A20
MKSIKINQEPQEVSQLFEGRNNFAVIGLTGRTGSGCTTAANILESEPTFPTHHDARSGGEPLYSGLSTKRYNIVKNFASKNWDRFFSIKVSDLISAYILQINIGDLVNFICESADPQAVDRAKVENLLRDKDGAYQEAVRKLAKYEHFSKYIINRDMALTGESKNGKGLKHYMLLVRDFTSKFKKDLINLNADLYILVYQSAGNSIRRTGAVICEYEKEEFKAEMVFHLPESINRIIKLIRRSRSRAFIVIDAIRNPHEARFFKDRYSAFYLMSINAPNADRQEYLTAHHKFNKEQVDNIDKVESGDWLKDKDEAREYGDKSKSERSWISQNVKKCIEMSDIHVFNPRNELPNNNVLKAQLAWYVSLIKHPGLISPTPMERVMQIAYTAKANSGCISRQVGAVITNNDQSIKAIGWNDVAEGQYPCALRSVDGALNEFDSEIYSEFERSDNNFRDSLKIAHKNILDNPEILSGRNCSYCFKDIKNSADKKGNQVHTRSLHAEENAFLQITKYGGQPIQGGKLYTTASPCELCSKKAYQLGVEEIIFIDPYPGIAKEHILAIGRKPPKLIQFRGAVGKAYHMLYEPVIAYKDELEFFR